MKKIIVTKLMRNGSTLGAYTFSYLVQFPHNTWNYSFTASEEGMRYATEAWKNSGIEIIHIDKTKVKIAL
jgi:hypothetical protein